METTINVKIENMIRAKTFLPYLYNWKRTMLETAKESYHKDIRIVITNTGTIMFTCPFDEFINCMEFLTCEFEKARMGHYLVFDEKVDMKTKYVTKIELDDFYQSEKGELKYDYGIIEVGEGIATLKYESYEDGEKLMQNFRDIYMRYEEEYYNVVIVDDDSDSYSDSYLLEGLMASSVILWSGLKIFSLCLEN